MTKPKDLQKPQRLLRALLLLAITLSLGIATIWALKRGREEPVQEAERELPLTSSQRISTDNGEGIITLDAAAQDQIGLHTATPQQTQYHEQLRGYAAVIDPQPLADLDNNYALAKAQLNSAQAKLDASSAEFEREDKLFKAPNSVVTIDKLQAVEATFHVDEAALASAEAQLRSVSQTAVQTWGPVLGQALIDGAPMLTRLVKRDDVLIQVTLPVGESIATPPAAAFVESNNGLRYQIQFVSPTTKTDPRIQGISFFYVAPAASDLLSGMNVRAFLPSGATIEGVVVPQAAVVWWQGRAWVYVRTAPQRFTRREITTNDPTETGYFQPKGLSAGDEVVVQGAQMLLSEEFRPQPQPGGKKVGGVEDDD